MPTTPDTSRRPTPDEILSLQQRIEGFQDLVALHPELKDPNHPDVIAFAASVATYFASQQHSSEEDAGSAITR